MRGCGRVSSGLITSTARYKQKPRPAKAEQGERWSQLRCAYLARRHTVSDFKPLPVAGLLLSVHPLTR